MILTAKKTLSVFISIILICSFAGAGLAFADPEQVEDPVASVEKEILTEAKQQTSKNLTQQELSPLATKQPISEIFPGDDGILAKWVANKMGKTVSDEIELADLNVVTQIVATENPTEEFGKFLDWSGIEKLTNLEVLDLGACDLEQSNLGDIAALANLRELNLNACSIKGDLGSFKGLTSLVDLDLQFARGIKGNLSSLKDLTSVESFRIAGNEEVKGSLADLNKMTALTRFHLGGTSITGKLSDLGAHPSLLNFKAIYLPQTYEISGDVGVFANCTQIEEFAIYDSSGEETSRMTGNLDFLGNNPNLTSVEVNSLEFTGSIDVMFKNAAKLITVAVNCPKVTGDLSVFKGKTELRTANLLKVDALTGSIENFKDSKWLGGLQINAKNVTGALGNLLPSMMEIQQLDVSGTSVTATLADVGTRRALQYVNLAGLGVTGDLSELAELFKSSGYFSNLNLSNNPAVTGDVSLFRTLVQDHNAFGWLTVVSLANTAVVGDIESFSHIKSLGFLTLSGTNVYGDVQTLENVEDLELLELENMKINLPSLVFYGAPQTVAIPMLAGGIAFDPINITGGKATKSNNNIVWEIPSDGQGTLSYSFDQQVKIQDTYYACSGTVSQDYTKLAEVYQFIDDEGNPIEKLSEVTDTSKTYTVRVNADFDHFIDDKGELVGGVAFNNVVQKFGTHYVAEGGSTIITLEGSVFEGLENNDYNLTVFFSDGYARGDVPVNIGGPTPTPTPTPDPIPVTGDNLVVWPFVVVAVLAGVVLLVVFLKRRKE